MKGFNFEKDLAHQKQAVENTISVFDNVTLNFPSGINKNQFNPFFDFANDKTFSKNIRRIQEENAINEKPDPSTPILDIMMETGTGKTYTYTKTIFELNRQFGIFKFIIVVPTLSIKAGTIDFLKSESCREHFKEQYGKILQLHIVESQKGPKAKKSYLPPSVMSFANAGNFEKGNIQVMVINAGMINSETMKKSFDRKLFDEYSTPFSALSAIGTFMIIDEPHKFGESNTTWTNIQKMNPQCILRYGATFPDKETKQKNGNKAKDYKNLIYQLTAVDAFHRNLVKGVIGHITEFDAGKNAIVKLIDSDGTEASFELTENGKKKTIKLSQKENFKKVHPEMTDLTIENLNKTKVVLSNGLELSKGDKLNPYSYSEKLQETVIQKAIQNHFALEKQFLTRDVKIKPLTLFFIDNIEEYRNKEGYIRKTIEEYARSEIKNILKTENNSFYKSYLEKSLEDLSLTHAGYFSKDNTEKDEAIEKEINEILHDKQAMLDLENPRRFIFSKWTLREGWDNPNVFQICKLRSSGSDISKLQEVGRGLRLPVNQYGNRVKDEEFFLNYFVDFTESDFVEKLVCEINEKSGTISIEETPDKLTDVMIQRICELYETKESELLEQLDANNAITRANSFKEGGFAFIKENYPKIFGGINSDKVRKATHKDKKLTIRKEKYSELKYLWEKLNEKVILEYKFENEDLFKTLVIDFLKEEKLFNQDHIHEKIAKVEIQENKAIANESHSIENRKLGSISTMKYSIFLEELSRLICINKKTLHEAILESGKDLSPYLNQKTLREIKQNFDHFLMANAFDKFSIEYKKISNSVHPTKFTDAKGNILTEISPSDVGRQYSREEVAEAYLFDVLYHDSDLEKVNIKEKIREVIVFTKIPKNSIKIPVAGGKSYSPDFAYVLKLGNGKQKLHFIIETKDVRGDEGLREEEKYKIKHAEKFFGDNVKIQFRTQFQNDKIVDLIQEITFSM